MDRIQDTGKGHDRFFRQRATQRVGSQSEPEALTPLQSHLVVADPSGRRVPVGHPGHDLRCGERTGTATDRCDRFRRVRDGDRRQRRRRLASQQRVIGRGFDAHRDLDRDRPVGKGRRTMICFPGQGQCEGAGLAARALSFADPVHPHGDAGRDRGRAERGHVAGAVLTRAPQPIGGLRKQPEVHSEAVRGRLQLGREHDGVDVQGAPGRRADHVVLGCAAVGQRVPVPATGQLRRPGRRRRSDHRGLVGDGCRRTDRTQRNEHGQHDPVAAGTQVSPRPPVVAALHRHAPVLPPTPLLNIRRRVTSTPARISSGTRTGPGGGSAGIEPGEL